MAPLRRESHSATRLFAAFAALSLVPILVLGLVLARSYQSSATSRGLVEAQSEADLFAATAVEPILDGRDLRLGISPLATRRLSQLARDLSASGVIPRFRLRDLEGVVVFSADGSGESKTPEAEAVEAAKGEPVALMTRLNADENDSGPVGDQAVEIYLALNAGIPAHPVGVLEVYLPYAPIQRDIDNSTMSLYRNLGIGLGVLYVLLAGLSIITTRRLRKQVERNAYLAEHDALTGLPNRRLFHRRVAEMIDHSQGRAGAIAIIDLDRFKVVNDSLGHENGDALLTHLSTRLAEAIRPGDTVARLGGDEFGVILPRIVTEIDAVAILERLLVSIAEPVEIRGLPLSAEASVGYALVPDDGLDSETLMQRADIAMYVAKSSHTGVTRYRVEHDDYDADRLAVVSELRRALSNDELLLHYQPQLHLPDDSVTGVEALIRWNHPTRGMLQPQDFLPLAEQTGLINPLTDWVIGQALRQIHEWGSAGERISISVNVSARNLTQASFASNVLAALNERSVPSSRLILEITETAIFTDIGRAQRTLTSLVDAGVRISIDDFGQGQTSLGLLSHLPIHELKVDRAFVTDMMTNDAHRAIVHSVVDLAHNLGFLIVAEGVENNETLEALSQMGCDFAQGFGITPAMPGSALLDWLDQRPTHVRRIGARTLAGLGTLRR